MLAEEFERPLPVRFAQDGLGSGVDLTRFQTFLADIPGEARVLLSCTENAGSPRNLRSRQELQRSWGSFGAQTKEKQTNKKRPSVATCNGGKERFKKLKTPAPASTPVVTARLPALPVASRGTRLKVYFINSFLESARWSPRKPDENRSVTSGLSCFVGAIRADGVSERHSCEPPCAIHLCPFRSNSLSSSSA